MRVLQAMAGAQFGGAETYFVELVTALNRAGLDQKVVIRGIPARAQGLRRAGIEPAQIRFGGIIDCLSGPRLRRIIASYKPDIVQSWMHRATRFVSRPPEAADFVHVGWFGGYYQIDDYRACDHLVGVTADIRDHQVRQGWPQERAHYIPTFAHTETVAPVPREGLGTPQDAPLFLALGRLHESKALDVLIRATAQVPGAHVWIAGEGPLRRTLARLIAGLGLEARVKLLGWREDRQALLAAADYCVLPSRFEPFGTVMIEAWAQNVPLIAAAADGPRGLIEDGRNGLLVAIDDTEGLARAMKRLAREPRLCARLVAEARIGFDAAYTEAAVVKRVLDFYRALVGS